MPLRSLYKTKIGTECYGRLVAVHKSKGATNYWQVFIETRKAIRALPGPPLIRQDYTSCIELIEELDATRFARIF
jgi:hypothetical protein